MEFFSQQNQESEMMESAPGWSAALKSPSMGIHIEGGAFQPPD